MKNFMFITSFLLFICFYPVNCQQCSFEFDIYKYTGAWFEIASTNIIKDTIERNCSCSNTYYTAPNSTFLNVTNSCDYLGTNYTIKGYANVSSVNSFHVTFPLYSNDNSSIANYHIVYVNLDKNGNYREAIVTGQTPDYIWFLSRTPTVSNRIYSKLFRASVDSGLDISNITLSQQDNCTTFLAQNSL